MGGWSRAELEEAFAAYQRAGQEAAKTGDWSSWADLFTEDAVYVEHLFGTSTDARRSANGSRT